MSKTIVYVIDWNLVDNPLPHLLSKKHPTDTIYILLIRFTAVLKYSYPRGLKFSNLPHIETPVYNIVSPKEPNNLIKTIHVDQHGNSNRVEINHEKLLQDADQIVFACNPDASGVSAFQTLLTDVLGQELAEQKREALFITVRSYSSLKKCLDNPISTTDDWFKEKLSYGLAKRYFDFNFNTNAIIIFGDILRQNEIDTTNYFMSKFSLQVLFDLAENPSKMGLYIAKMDSEWKGTGRYEKGSIGSVSSYSEIVLGLIEKGLLNKDEDKILKVSSTGLAFLSSLHPDCKDLDLPFRLAEWCDSWPNSKPKIDRYIKTFFGKQKRFNNGIPKRRYGVLGHVAEQRISDRSEDGLNKAKQLLNNMNGSN